MLSNGIRHVTCAPFHPSSNELAERALQTFKNGLKKMTRGDVATRLVRFLFKYRYSPQSVTGTSPAELLMGRQIRSHLSNLHPDLCARVRIKQDDQKWYHDRHTKLRQFDVSDQVWARNFSGRG